MGYTAPEMDMRAQVWSPLQNAAVWIGAWLYHLEPADELLGALEELGGQPIAPDFPVFLDFLGHLRSQAGPSLADAAAGPALRLILSGPGDPPALPAGSDSARAAAAHPAGALVLRTGSNEHLVIFANYAEEHDCTEWTAVREALPLPAPAWLSPGDADALLTQATSESADLIEATGYVTNALNNPRLTVGTLTDFYDTPGLPSATPPRAAKLFARADRVAAIIETVTDRMGDHTLDPHLLRLWRHVRQARMAGVAYCLADFARTTR